MTAKPETTAQLLSRLEANISLKGKGRQTNYAGMNTRSKKGLGKPVAQKKRHPWKGAK